MELLVSVAEAVGGCLVGVGVAGPAVLGRSHGGCWRFDGAAIVGLYCMIGDVAAGAGGVVDAVVVAAGATCAGGMDCHCCRLEVLHTGDLAGIAYVRRIHLTGLPSWDDCCNGGDGGVFRVVNVSLPTPFLGRCSSRYCR